MKNKSLFLVLVILCLTSVEIYSSRQELKFDAPRAQIVTFIYRSIVK